MDRSTHWNWRFGVAALLATATFYATARAASEDFSAPPYAPAANELTTEIVAKKLDRLAADTTMDAEVRGQLIDFTRRTLDELEMASDWEARTQKLADALADIPRRVAELKVALHNTTTDELPALPTSLTDLERKLVETERELHAARDKLVQLAAEPKRQSRRRAELFDLYVANQEQRSELTDELSEGDDEDNVELQRARSEWGAARNRSLTAETDAYRAEAALYDRATIELNGLERDQHATVIRNIQRRTNALEQALTAALRNEAARRTAEAKLLSATVPERLRSIPARLASYAVERCQLAEQQATVWRRNLTAMDQRDRLDERARLLNDQVEAARGTCDVGELLRRERNSLPDTAMWKHESRTRTEEAERVETRMFELEDRRTQLADIETCINDEQRLAGIPTEESDRVVRALLETERVYLTELNADLSSYLKRLMATNLVIDQMREKVRKQMEYVQEHVLWEPTAPAVSTRDLTPAAEASLWLVNRRNWRSVEQSITQLWDWSPRTTLLLLAIPPLGLYVLRYLRRELRRLSALAQCDEADFKPTVRAAVVTGLLTTIWPCLLLLVAQQISLGESDFCRALAQGIQLTALAYWPLELVRQICRHHGLAEAHFGWSRPALASLRRHIRWMMLVYLPLVVLVATVFFVPGHEEWKDSFVKLGLIANLAVLTLFLLVIARPVHTLLRQSAHELEGNWLGRIEFVWYLVVVAAPSGLAAMAGTGYLYTALHLMMHIQQTVWLSLGMMLAYALIRRWFVVAQQRKARLAGTDSIVPSIQDDAADEPGEHQQVVHLQSRRLLHGSLVVGLVAGLAIIWRDVVPALHIVDHYVLWYDSAHDMPITLANVAQALLAICVTAAAAQNLPGMIEVALLERLSIEASVRIALGTVLRYTILVVGLLAASTSLGIGWAKVQWLVAAITFGLGFGLQEIVANFVSGLIVLFERPVRVGDTVTVGDVTGVVSRIRMRATTITDWDRKELIVPNKEFITGRLMNWTLTDKIVRVVVRVTVAFGTDTRLTQQLLMRVARENIFVLRDPSPRALFVSFGENVMNFELRVFVADVERCGPVQHELNTAIAAAFAIARIRIAEASAKPKGQLLPAAVEEAADTISMPGESDVRERPRGVA